MKILIVYASNSGSTFQVAEIVQKVLSKKYEVTFKKAVMVAAADFAEYDCVVLGSPSWSVEKHEGYPLESMLALLRSAQKVSCEKTLFAVFGCGDTSFTHFCGAVDFMEGFVRDVHGTLVLESLRVDSFYFDLKNALATAEDWSERLLASLKKY